MVGVTPQMQKCLRHDIAQVLWIGGYVSFSFVVSVKRNGHRVSQVESSRNGFFDISAG